jgi:diguanylate cyclase (GGDEF)-like protein
LHQLARQRFQMNEDELLEFLGPLGSKAADFAALLQVDIGEASDFTGALARASEELVQLTLSTSLDNQRAMEMTRRAESEAQHWRQEAVFDPLTKLFNRRFLDRKLQEFFENTKRNAGCFGVLCLDLDGFKPLNDRFGHAFGDIVLQRVAECLLAQVRQGDIVARQGGDEFCVVADCLDELNLQSLGQRTLSAIQNLTIQHGTNEGRVGVSIGAVCCNPSTPWQKTEDLLHAADHAMYMAKSQGKNRVVFLRSLEDAAIAGAAPAPKSSIPVVHAPNPR